MKKFLFVILGLTFLFFIGCKTKVETEKSENISRFINIRDAEVIELEVGEEHILNIVSENVTLIYEYDDTIINITDSKITALKEGELTVSVKAKEDSELVVTFEVRVKAKPVEEIKVTGIAVSYDDPMMVGSTQVLEVTIDPENATNKGVTYKSSNTNILTVDENGLVTAVDIGTATITIETTDGSKKSTDAVITVAGKQVTSITLAGEDTVKVGKNIKLTATVLPEDAENMNVAWSSSNEGVAKVEGGKVTGISAGTATIRATAKDGSGVYGEKTITVLEDDGPVEPTGVILVCNGNEYKDRDTIDLEVGETYEFSFKYLPADKEVQEGVDCSLYDEKFCTIENNSFVTTAIGRVAFQVYALYGDAEALFVINVTEKYYAPTEIIISTDALFVEVGVTAKFTASILPVEAHQNVIWSTSDSSIATISEDGVLTGVAVGTVKVIAKPADGEDLEKEYEFEVKENTTVDKLEMVVDPSYTATGSTVTVNEKEYTIGKNAFDNLAQAINEAVEGSVIYVAAGEYSADTATLSVNNVTVLGPNANVNPVANHERDNEAKVATVITVNENVSNFVVKGLYLQDKFNIKLTGGNENIEASFNYIYATSADGIITFSDSNKSVKGLKMNYNYSPKYVAYRLVYAWNVEDVEIIGNEIWGSNEIQYVCDILNVQGMISGNVTIRDNRFDKLYQSVCYCKGVGVINVLFQNNVCSNVTCTIIDFRDMKASGDNKFNILYNTFDTCGRFVPGNTSQADWGMVRISTAGYKDTDTIEINVNYNIFKDAESDDNGLFVAWNRGKSSSLEKFVKIVNYDNNYFNGKTSSDWPSDYFGNTDASVANVYTNIEDVPTTEPLDYRFLYAKRIIVINKLNTQDATDDFAQYYGLCMFDKNTTPDASLYWQKATLAKQEDGTYKVVEVKASGESLSESYDYYLLMFDDETGNAKPLKDLALVAGETVILSVDPASLENGACSIILAVVE